MTSKPADDSPPAAASPKDRAAAEQAKGSVHEAIGKLLGDDDASRHGQEVKRAARAEAKKQNKTDAR